MLPMSIERNVRPCLLISTVLCTGLTAPAWARQIQKRQTGSIESDVQLLGSLLRMNPF